MSTRATYRFTGRYMTPVILYIHYDGYESGAAAYFWHAHHFANERGGFAGQFFRANDLAEFTNSHEGHGDTEYRYDFNTDNGELIARKRVSGWDFDKEPQFRAIYSGPWYEFVNAHPQQIEGFTALRALKRESGQVQVWSADQLIAYVELRQKEADEYAAKFPQYTGNIASYAADVKRLRAMLEDYRAQGGVTPKADCGVIAVTH